MVDARHVGWCHGCENIAVGIRGDVGYKPHIPQVSVRHLAVVIVLLIFITSRLTNRR